MTTTNQAALLARRDILDSFLSFAAELDHHRRAVARIARTRRAMDAVEGRDDVSGEAGAAAMPGADPTADAMPAFLLDAPVGLTGLPDPEGDPLDMTVQHPVEPEIILEKLQTFLEAEARVFARTATDVMLAQYREAQYAMVALADDIFLHELEWPGRDIWRADHLEQRVFQSRLAGDRIFDRMDALLASGDRRLVQLACVYLCILSLGFRGRFRGPSGETAVRGYAQRLFEMISGRDPELLGDFTSTVRPLVPMAYANTVSGDASRRARFHPRWPLIIGGIVAAWLLVGQGVWLFAASDTAGAAEQVLRAAGEAR